MDGDENTTTEVQDVIEEVLPDSTDTTDPDLANLADETVQPKGKTVQEKMASERKRAEAAQRQKDRDAGRTTLQANLDKRAKDAGFESVEQMLKSGGQKPKPAEQKGPQSDKAAQAESTRLQGELKTAQNQIRGLRSRIEALESELELRQTAYENDVLPEDIDYALSQVQSHYKRLDKDAAEKFDHKTFFKTDLKTRKPSIFRQAMQAKVEERKVEEVAVSTTPTTKTPAGPKAAEVRKEEADGQKPKRVQDMTKQEYRAYMAARNIKDPEYSSV